MSAAQLLPTLRNFSVNERAWIAQAMIESLDSEHEQAIGYEEAWDQELNRRWDEIRTGEAVGIAAAQVFAEIESRYA